jgi:MFS family permease
MTTSSFHYKPVVFTTLGLSVLASAAVLPIIAPLIRSLHLSPSQGGWMLSIGSLVMTLAAPVWGRAADRIGRRQVMLAGFAGMGAAYLVFALTVKLGQWGWYAGWALLAAVTAGRALLGAFLPSVTAAAQALVADHTTEAERSRGMAVIGAANGAGFVLGPALGGLASAGGLLWPLVAAGALCLVAMAYTAVRLPRLPRWDDAAPRVAPPGRIGWAAGRWLLASALTWFAIVSVQIAGSFYFQERLGLANEQAAPRLAIALTLCGASLLAVQLLQLRRLRWGPQPLVISGALLWTVATLVLLFTADAAAYLVGYAMLGAAAGLLLPGCLAGASLAAPRDSQGAIAGLSAAAQGIGFVVGPVASTLLYEIDPSAPLWCLAMVMQVLAVLAFAPEWLASRRAVET